MLPLLLGPGKPHPRADDRRKNCEERLADRAKKGKIPFPIATVEVVEKDASDPARLVPVLEIEIFVAPRFEPGVTVGVVGCAGGGEAGMELLGCRGVGIDRGEIGTTTDP